MVQGEKIIHDVYRVKCQINIDEFPSGYLASEYLASEYLASGASEGTFQCGREKVLRRSGLALGLHSVRHYWD